MLCLLLAVQWLAFPIYAQTYSYRHYTVEDGLPTNYVYGGLQDSRGYIWFYTEKGVSRFDGYEFRNFTTEDGLPTNDVWQLMEDSQGRMWVGCFGDRIVAIEKDTVVTLFELSGQMRRDLKITKINDRLWIYILSPKPFTLIDHDGRIDTIYGEGFSKRFKQQALEQGFDQYPYIIDLGLQVYFRTEPPSALFIDGSRQQVDTVRIEGLDKELATLFYSSLDNVYFTHKRHLYISHRRDSFIYHIDLKEKKLERQNAYQALGGFLDYRLFQRHSPDHFLLQTNRGAIVYEPPFRAIDTFVVQLRQRVNLGNIFIDKENNYWIPTRGQGVYLLTAQARRTEVLSVPSQNETTPLCELAFSPDGQLYAGTQHGAVYRLENNQLQQLVPPPSYSMNDLRRVRKLIFTEEGGWWMARQGHSLLYFPPNSNEGIPFGALAKDAEVVDMEQGEEQSGISNLKRYLLPEPELYIKDLAWHEPTQRLYAARRAYGYLYQNNASASGRLTVVSPVRNHAAHFTSDGILWMGLKQGLARYQNGVYQPLKTNTEIDERAVFCFAEDERQRLWVGTDGAGIFSQQKGKFVQIPGTEGLIIQDLCIKEGTVWGATNKGIWKIDINPSGGAGIVEEVYSTSHGLPSPEIMAVEASEHYVYAATSKGLAQLQLHRPKGVDTEMTLLIDQIKINGEKVGLDSVYQLNYKQNEIEINFTALSYKSQGNITYFYQLENADRATLSTTNRQLRYGGLKPGHYTLRIFAQDTEKRVSPVKRLQFKIAPPWWQRPSALIIGALLLGLLGWLGYRRRVHQIQQQAESEMALNKQFAELELKALQAQMNPHFVFNSLSAIQYFIQINEKEQAEDYLAKFATLMRLFLESSKNKYINLVEELRLIRLYVELEQLRFRNKFTFHLQVDPSINQHTTLVPTMLLQPFVENAINHGLFHKKEQGKLSIRISPQPDGGLSCLLEDDGVGRKQAIAIQKQNQRHHRSRALQITNERLHALSTVEGYDIKIAITDLTSPSGEAAGTRVEIIIPTIE